jgi:sensor domain CHASE-containing protein
MNFLKNNAFNILNLVVLVYVILELQTIKKIAISTNVEAELNNIKLDFVESDINADMILVDSIKRRLDERKQELRNQLK